MKSLAWVLLPLAGALSLSACGDQKAAGQDGGAPVDAHFSGFDAMQTAAAVIGPAGGTLTSPGGVTIDVPRNALAAPTNITIADNAGAGPAGAHTPIVEFGPGDLVFARPATVHFTATYAGGVTPACYWTEPTTDAFEDIGGAAAAGGVGCQIVHLGHGYAGESSGVRTVYGSAIVTFHQADGIANLPIDLSAGAFEALVPNATGYTVLLGSGVSIGLFSIPNVPRGPYVFQRGGTLISTSADVVDLGFDLLGPSDAAKPSQTTEIDLTVSGLDPWVASDDLELFAPTDDTWAFGLALSAVAGGPAVGDAALTHFTVDSYMTSQTSLGTIGNLITGQPTFLAQLSTHTLDNGTVYLSTSRVFSAEPFVQTDGGKSTLSGAFVDVSNQAQATIDLRASQFEAAGVLAAMGPNAKASGTFFEVYGQPGGLADGPFSLGADLVLLQPTHTDLVGANMGYGLPPAGDWGAYGVVQSFFEVDYALPGLTPAKGAALVEVDDTLDAIGAGPLVPRVGPPQHVTISDKDALSPQSGVGRAPTIAWQAPAIGTPSAYQVGINQLVASGQNTTSVALGRFTTHGTSVRLPDASLTAGSTYFISVTAYDSDVPIEALGRAGLPFASATMLSATFTP